MIIKQRTKMKLMSTHNLKMFVSSYKIAVMVVIAGFISNMVVKGFMKSVGILFDNFMDKWEGKISEVSASMVPTFMHLFFNTISLIVPPLCETIGVFYTNMLGIFLISASLCSIAIPIDLMPYLQMAGMGAGCGFCFHSGVLIINRNTNRNNGLANGLVLAGNSLGTIIVAQLMGRLFDIFHFEKAVLILGVCTFIQIPSAFLYFHPSKVALEEDRKRKESSNAPKWWHKILNKELLNDPRYYLLCLSQCFNAIGFTTATSYLPRHLSKMEGLQMDNTQVANVISAIQIADLVARFTIPAASDQFPGFRWLFYSAGLVGAGGTIFGIVATSEQHWVYATCIIFGVWSAAFIGSWNSLVKDTIGGEYFGTLYAHSLFFSGFAALGGTPLIVQLGGNDGFGNNARILQICGCLLILGAIPVLFLKFAKLTEPKDSLKDIEMTTSTKEKSEENTEGKVETSNVV